MRITYNLPQVFNPSASQAENAQVLRVLLDCLIQINLAYLKNHAAADLYQSGVVYGRTKIWECIPALYQRGFGDCKSLSAALVAQYLRQGKKCRPVFRWIKSKNPNRIGETDYHILVQTEDGRFEDPSKVLGMGREENRQFYDYSE